MDLDIRVVGLAATLALVALIAGLGLAVSDAQAPELPAILTDGFALAFTQGVGELPAACGGGPYSADCTYY